MYDVSFHAALKAALKAALRATGKLLDPLGKFGCMYVLRPYIVPAERHEIANSF